MSVSNMSYYQNVQLPKCPVTEMSVTKMSITKMSGYQFDQGLNVDILLHNKNVWGTMGYMSDVCNVSANIPDTQ